MICKKINFDEISKFKMDITHINLDSNFKENVNDSHIHQECEIYFNLTGDVSFMVEDNIYPISTGSAIITRPYEYHHCIYNSNAMHEHYWILFSCEKNEKVLDLFFNRNVGENNLIVLKPEKTTELVSIFNSFIKEDMTEFEKHCNFFKILDILGNGAKIKSGNSKLSPEIAETIKLINKNFSNEIAVGEIAKTLHISINTLERHFKNQIGITMREYIFEKRMSNAVRLLAESASVLEACEKSGFSDYSHFIACFKKKFGITPLAYKKQANL